MMIMMMMHRASLTKSIVLTWGFTDIVLNIRAVWDFIIDLSIVNRPWFLLEINE